MENINTKKVIERIVEEFEKNNSAQDIINTCEQDLLTYYYWEYKELAWEHLGWIKKMNLYMEDKIVKLIKILKDSEEKNTYISFLEARRDEELKIWGESLINTAELMEEITRQEMLLNLKEQGYE